MKVCPTCGSSFSDTLGYCPHDASLLEAQSALGPGAVIRGKYKILEELGRGGMGVVYRARHMVWNEDKAIKVLLNTETPELAKAFLGEAMVLRRLQHPNIVRVEDVDRTEDNLSFVVMEFIEGESLRARMERVGAMAPRDALQVAAQVCAALTAAHEIGVIHRDIKPQNILFARQADGSESVKIIDFGIAKVREDANLGVSGMLTNATGYFLGTPEYSSPEQAKGVRGSELDGRTDLYSLGIVLYQMVTGKLPFEADTPVGMLVQRLHAKPIAPDQVRSGIPANCSLIVMKALEQDRDNRFRTAAEMRGSIEAALAFRESRPLPAPAPQPPPPAPMPVTPSFPVESGLVCASPLRRAGAIVVDWVMMYAVLMVVALGLAAARGRPLDRLEDSDTAGPAIFVWIFYVLYCLILESRPRAATFGKRLMGLRVCGSAGQPLGFGTVLWRFFCSSAALMIPLGYLAGFFDARRRMIHDRVSGTMVIRNRR